MERKRERVGIAEIFGLLPADTALKTAMRAVFGEKKIPPTKFDLSSVKIFKPHISIPAWLGMRTGGRKAPVYNYFNRLQPGRDEVFSVKVTNCRDWQGGEFTYDSHLGTDFALPVGTRLTTCAPGRVIAIMNQLDHGGLKVFIDHGEGIITTYGHMSRASVRVGENVSRGQVIGLSGAAGIELILFFPWVAPHLHLTVLLNGEPVDPFGADGEIPLWRNGNDPVPHTGPDDSAFEPTQWSEELIDAAIDDCSDPDERETLRAIPDIVNRAAEVINYRKFYNTLFSEFPPVYETEYARKAIFDLPLCAEDYDGVKFP